MSHGFYGDVPGRRWSVRNYVRFSLDRPDLPKHLQSAWTYYGLFPNTGFVFTPEGAQFYHGHPAGARDAPSGRAATACRTKAARRGWRVIWPSGSTGTHRPRIAAVDLVERVDEVGRIRGLPPFRPGIRPARAITTGCAALMPVMTARRPRRRTVIASLNAELSCQTGAGDNLKIKRPVKARGETAMRLNRRHDPDRYWRHPCHALWVRPSWAQSGSVNVYNWADYIGETTLADFEAETGIGVVYDLYAAEEMQAKMLAGSTGYDVVLQSGLSLPHSDGRGGGVPEGSTAQS
jgi:hypothetical protein